MKKSFKNIYQRLFPMPLWLQQTLLMAFTTLLPVFIISYTFYTNSSAGILENESTTSAEILELEISNLDAYIKDLCNAASQPLYDSTLSAMLSQTTPLSDSQKSYIAEQCKWYYYSREDVKAIRLYLLSQDSLYHRAAQIYRYESLDTESFKESKLYKNCAEGPYYFDISPASDGRAVLTYSHALINLKTQVPYAIVSFDVSQKIVGNMAGSGNNRIFRLFNETGELLYSSLDSDDEKLELELNETPEQSGSQSKLVTIGNASYLRTTSGSKSYGFNVEHYMPYTIIQDQLAKASRFSLIIGLAVWIILIIISGLTARAATLPLSKLASQLHGVGEGIFALSKESSGSREIKELRDDYNYMVTHIDSLIRDNYVSALNEKNARLIALEAQLNPHFLYNTLQAIGTEALVHDQPQIYKMLTILAANLRYTIKEGDLVPLRTEYEYSRNYVHLQKLRHGELLNVSFNIQDDILDLIVPKISLQLLIENSIVHGFREAQVPLSISVNASLQGHELVISVLDDGRGIDNTKLTELKTQLSESGRYDSSSIGLYNLAGRLSMLYAAPGTLTIDSAENEFTEAIMTIPYHQTTKDQSE